MAESLATDLTLAHAREVDLLEDDEVIRLARIYEQARKEILARLATVDADRFTAQQHRVALAQIEAGLAKMLERMDRGAHAVDSLFEQSIEMTLAEIGFWESKFRGGATQRIRANAARRISGPKALLLQRRRSSIAAYGQQLRTDIQGRLAVHLVKNSSWREMSLDVAGRLDQAAVIGSKWKGERIVRTEMNSVLNVGHQATIAEASETILPGLKQQWDAIRDERSSDICLRLKDRVREVGKPFGTYKGRPIVAPPAIPNCRSRLIPWHEDWAEVDPTILAEDAPKPVTRKHTPGPRPKRKAETKKAKKQPAPEPKPEAVALGDSTEDVLKGWHAKNTSQQIAVAEHQGKLYSAQQSMTGGEMLIQELEESIEGKLRWKAPPSAGAVGQSELRQISGPMRQLLAQGKLEIEVRPLDDWKKRSGKIVHTATGEPLVKPPPKFPTLDEGAAWAKKHFARKVDFAGWKATTSGDLVDEMNEVLEAAYEMFVSRGRHPLDSLVTTDRFSHWADAGYGSAVRFRRGLGEKDLLTSRSRQKESYASRIEMMKRRIEHAQFDADSALTSAGRKAAEKRVKQLKRDLEHAPDRHNVLSERPFRDLARHEFAHILHQRMPGGMSHGYKELGGTSKGFRQQIQGKIGAKGKRELASPISDYSSKDTHEHFAEATAAYMLGGAERARVSSEVQRIIEEVLAGGY